MNDEKINEVNSHENGPRRSGIEKEKLYPELSRRRVWVFRILAAIIMPLMALFFLEIALRLIGFGYPSSAFLRWHVNNRPVYCSNIKFGWQFFPPKISREFENFVIPEEKGDCYRIFILGESAAMGEPDPGYCFGRQLRVMLHQQYPSVNFEVFTAAMPAINSHCVARIARDCARLKPDLFVVYMGNNEVIGPYGAGTIFSPLTKNLILIRISIAFKSTRIGELITSIAGHMKKSPDQWGGLNMFLSKQIRHDDERMQYVYSHFQSNLEDIIKCAQKAGAKTIVSTVAVNLKDCPPFASLHRTDIGDKLKEFDKFLQHGIELEKAGDYNNAIASYLSAAAIDDTYAELQFRIGQCMWNTGQFEKAGEYYKRAMDFDTLRFRADSKINQIIREVSDKKLKDVYFVDSVNVFAKASTGNCPGYELLWEHVHLTFAGNYLLARSIFERVADILPKIIKEQKSRETIITEAECVKRMAYTEYDNFRLTKLNLDMFNNQPTFKNQLYHDEIVKYWTQNLEELKVRTGPGAIDNAIQQYQNAVKLQTDDVYLARRYALYLWQTKKNPTDTVVKLSRYIAEQIPHDVLMLNQLAEIEYRIGDTDSALKRALKASQLNPMNGIAHYSAGMLYEKKGQYNKAIKYLNKAINLDPEVPLYYKSLALILLNDIGKADKAEQIYRKGIEMVANDASLHFNFAMFLKKKGQFEEAEKERRKAMALDPNLIHGGNPK